MKLNAIFPAGVTDITVHGLHQWDYGRELVIQAPDLPAIVEVHFACPGMTEAVVRVCSVSLGAATAVIPDVCLEQTQPVTAWVYFVSETSGHTALTVTLPVIARTRPAPSESIPAQVYDRYTELIGEVNAAVDSLAEGDVTVHHALNADNADHATTAQRAGRDINGVDFVGGYLKAPGDTYANADQGGLNTFYLPVVGKTVALKAHCGRWVDLGVVTFPAANNSYYLPPFVLEARVLGDAAAGPCFVLPSVHIDTAPGYYAGGQVVINLYPLTGNLSGVQVDTTTSMQQINLYFAVLN